MTESIHRPHMPHRTVALTNLVGFYPPPPSKGCPCEIVIVQCSVLYLGLLVRVFWKCFFVTYNWYKIVWPSGKKCALCALLCIGKLEFSKDKNKLSLYYKMRELHDISGMEPNQAKLISWSTSDTSWLWYIWQVQYIVNRNKPSQCRVETCCQSLWSCHLLCWRR